MQRSKADLESRKDSGYRYTGVWKVATLPIDRSIWSLISEREGSSWWERVQYVILKTVVNYTRKKNTLNSRSWNFLEHMWHLFFTILVLSVQNSVAYQLHRTKYPLNRHNHSSKSLLYVTWKYPKHCLAVSQQFLPSNKIELFTTGYFLISIWNKIIHIKKWKLIIFGTAWYTNQTKPRSKVVWLWKQLSPHDYLRDICEFFFKRSI